MKTVHHGGRGGPIQKKKSTQPCEKIFKAKGNAF